MATNKCNGTSVFKGSAPGDSTLAVTVEYSDTYLKNKALVFLFMEIIPGIAGIIIFSTCMFVMSIGISLFWKDFYRFKVKPRQAKNLANPDKSEATIASASNAGLSSSDHSRHQSFANLPPSGPPVNPYALRAGSGSMAGSQHDSDIHRGSVVNKGSDFRSRHSSVQYPSDEALLRGSIVTITFPRYGERTLPPLLPPIVNPNSVSPVPPSLSPVTTQAEPEPLKSEEGDTQNSSVLSKKPVKKLIKKSTARRTREARKNSSSSDSDDDKKRGPKIPKDAGLGSKEMRKSTPAKAKGHQDKQLDGDPTQTQATVENAVPLDKNIKDKPKKRKTKLT